jgi:hypothetical protein
MILRHVYENKDYSEHHKTRVIHCKTIFCLQYATCFGPKGPSTGYIHKYKNITKEGKLY